VAHRLLKWSRRHPDWVAGMAVVLLLLLAGSLWEWSRSVRQRNETLAQQAETERIVAEYLERAWRLREQGRWDEVARVLARAEERLAGSGPAGLLGQLRRTRDEADWVAELDEARLYAVEAGRERWRFFNFAGADRVYRDAFDRRGFDLSALDPDESAARIRTSAVCTQLVEALDFWAYVKDLLRPGSGAALWAVADRADADPWRQRLRRLLARKDRASLEQLAEEPSALAQPSVSLWLLSDALRRVGGLASAERLLRQSQQLHPADFWINFDLANLLAPNNVPPSARTEEGIGFLRAALAVRPRSPVAYNNLGVALKNHGRLPESVNALPKAIELKPGFAVAHRNLAATLQDLGQLPEAVKACRKVIDLNPSYPASLDGCRRAGKADQSAGLGLPAHGRHSKER
jgi:tetratricopeptide (TPR) repeat protein